MLFNSIDFLVFLPIVFLLYWFGTGRNRFRQNVLLLVASYVFYGWWDWRFLFLIAFSTGTDYLIGRALGKTRDKRRRKHLLWISILVNLGLLSAFKYFNFFIASFASAFTFFGLPIEANALTIILPVGISFYTFQTLSYTIDVYRGKMAPGNSLLEFAAFVSFFPQLVAGPIERAIDLLPQFSRDRQFRYEQAADGLRQILWGFVKKVVVGDSCALAINWMFAKPEEADPGLLLLGTIFFAFQCYGDFSGYSDIAIGTARLFGFKLTQNFAFPYFSRDIAEFWRRWHISLSTWLRDYLYIPLGGSRQGLWMTIRNMMLTFTICGFWHGPDWKYVIWGALHGLLMIPLLVTGRHRRYTNIVAADRWWPTIRELFQMGITFFLVAFSILFLRASSTEETFYIMERIFSDPVDWFSIETYAPYKFLLLTIFLFMIIEWKGRRQQYALQNIGVSWPRSMRWAFYQVLAGLVVYYLFTQETFEFVYFQF